MLSRIDALAIPNEPAAAALSLAISRNHGVGRQCRALRCHIDPRIVICSAVYSL